VTRHTLTRGGIILSAVDVGTGPAVLFQHGLGADNSQVAEIFPAEINVRRLTVECRSHGLSGKGSRQDLSIKTFGEDALAFLESYGVNEFIAGGISMGAAIALRLAVAVPQRVRALVLVRPAWLWDPAPNNMRPFAKVAEFLLSSDGPEKALARFDASSIAALLSKEAPDNLASLRRFFTHPEPLAIATLLSAISSDGPGVSEAEVASLKIPALVIGNSLDAVHPLEFAQKLSNSIPMARLVEVTSKSFDRTRHVKEVHAALNTFFANKPFDTR
jgi:pimeloyl-ACP methyl ester carboxylesterase